MDMPLVNVRVIESVSSVEQQPQTARESTETSARIEREKMRSLTWVIVEGVGSGDRGIGGKSATTVDVKALASGTGTAGRDTALRPVARLDGNGDGR
jgi:4-oxalocrotonate tautomerase